MDDWRARLNCHESLTRYIVGWPQECLSNQLTTSVGFFFFFGGGIEIDFLFSSLVVALSSSITAASCQTTAFGRTPIPSGAEDRRERQTVYHRMRSGRRTRPKVRGYSPNLKYQERDPLPPPPPPPLYSS